MMHPLDFYLDICLHENDGFNFFRIFHRHPTFPAKIQSTTSAVKPSF